MAKRPPVPANSDWLWTGSELLYYNHPTSSLVIQKVGGSNKGTYTYPLAQIAGIQITKPALMAPLGSFRVLVAGETAPRGRQGMLETARDPFAVGIGKNALADAERIAGVVRKAIADLQTPTAATTAAAPGLAEQLAQLGALRSQGVLSEAEFTAAKARLLGDTGPQDEAPRAW